jgi:PAS domain S-box-containing protein
MDSEETRRFFDSIIENIPNMVFVKDAKDLRFVLFNRAGEELLGLPRETFIGKTDYDFFPKEEADFFTAKDREALASGRVLDIPEEPIQTAGKGLRILHTKKITIPGPDGKPAYLLGISEDITERKRAERMTNEIVAMTTHELRTPLTSIVWGLDLLANSDPAYLTGKGLEVAKLSHGSAQLMVRLINDYLDVVKIESGNMIFKLRPQDLTALVEAAVKATQPFAETFGVRFELRREAPGARVEADPDRLTQVLTNLLSNAAKFSPAGAAVTVSVERRPEGLVRVGVRDRGPGIPDAFRAKIFQKFTQARTTDPKRKGTGLGLSISKAIVEKLKGRIGFETGPASGTTFYFDLPELPAR